MNAESARPITDQPAASPDPHRWQAIVTIEDNVERYQLYSEDPTQIEAVSGFWNPDGWSLNNEFDTRRYPPTARADALALSFTLPVGASRAIAARVPGGYAEKVALRSLMVDVASAILDSPDSDIETADHRPLGPSATVARVLEHVATLLDVTGPLTLARSVRPDIEDEIAGPNPERNS